MSRLPTPGSDTGSWGTILNDYLAVSLNSDGTLKSDLSAQQVEVAKAGTLQGTRKRINFIDGANATVTVADNSGNNRVDVTIAATSPFLLATDYGVTFDGTTDDATAMQSAIDAAITAGKPLFLSPGTAIIGTTLTVNSPITMLGSGRRSTTLKAANGLNDYVITFSGGTAGVGIIGAHLADFAIDGNSGGVTAGGGILANGAVQCSFERLHITSCYDWGLKLGPITGGAFGHHNRVVDCLFDNAGSSAGFGGGVWTTSSDENWFYGTDFEFLGGATAPVGSTPVMFLDEAGLQHVVASNFVSGSNNVIGVRVQNAKDTKVVGCTFDGVAGDSVFVSGTRCVIVANMFTSPGDAGSTPASGVHLEFNTHYNVVTGNVLETSNTAGKTRSLIREESTGGGGDNIITGNSMVANAAATVALLESAGANTIVRNNIGWVTESTGTATVANGTTSIAVNHGLSTTPALANISVTPTNNLGTATKFWISGVGATQFTVNVDADPGATTATFVWNARL